MIRNILDNTTELYMKKYTFGEIFSSRGETLCKNPYDETVQGHNKDLMLGKYLLSVLKKLPQIIESYAYELFNQAVHLNGSFVKKTCETEMKRFN